MKIPPEYHSPHSASALIKQWEEVARQLALEYGIFVKVLTEWSEGSSLPGSPLSNFALARIYFKVADHEFEGLNDLKKALDNKAFL